MHRGALMMCSVVLGLLVAEVARADAQARYAQQWQQRERTARDPNARVELAGELLAAARQADDADYKWLLGEKAVKLGSSHIRGYASAAAALDMMQRLSPDRRMWCLERLHDLYDSAYRRRPTKLRLGTGLANVLDEMAEQRVEDIDQRFNAGQADAGEAVKAYIESVRDVSRAVATLERVINRARADARKVERTHPDIARKLEAFVEEFQPQLETMTQRKAELTDAQRALMSLHAAERRFEHAPGTQTARQVAAHHIVQWNRPEAVDQKVVERLPESMQLPILLATVEPNKLTGPQADMLAKWYVGLADTTQGQPRQQMLIRARLYRELADRRGTKPTEIAMADITQLLNKAGVSEQASAHQARALQQRLNYQFGDPAATPEPPPRPTDPVDDPPSVDDPVHATDPPAATDTPAPRPPAAATGSTRTGGRPMVSCDQCGRRFFPGWGVEATTCTRCKSGGGNIFDFGND